MSKLKITRHEDPSHSWYAVKRELLESLGLMSEISACSYQKGKTVYLEEDCDMGLFLKAYAAKNNCSENWQSEWRNWFEIKSSHTNNSSPVRSYASFNPNMVMEFAPDMKIKLYGKEYTVTEVGPMGIKVKSPEGIIYRLKNSQKSSCMA